MKRLRLCILAAASLHAACFAESTPQPFGAGALPRIVAAHGQASVIVRFWSLDCGYCMKELPELKALAARRPAWKVVLVSVDDPALASEAAAVLRREGFEPGRTWMFADAHAQRLRHDIDRNWHGELPRTYLYRGGRQVAAISGPLDAAALDRHLGAPQ